MDVISMVTGLGGIGGVAFGISFLLYKCCRGRRFHSKSGCIDITVSAEVHPEQDSKESE